MAASSRDEPSSFSSAAPTMARTASSNSASAGILSIAGPQPTHGILLSPSRPSTTAVTASPAPLSRADDDRLGQSAFTHPPPHEHQQQPSGSSGSKLSTLISKLGRRSGSSAQQQQQQQQRGQQATSYDDVLSTTHAADSDLTPTAIRASSPSRRRSTDEHLHTSAKKSKHTKSRGNSGRHTPVVEGDYGQFLAAAELRAALEREQAKAAKKDKDKDKDKKASSKSANKAAAAQGAPPATQQQQPQEYATLMKPSRSLPGAFGTLSRASSRSERKGSGANTPRGDRKRGTSTELRAPNPCGMPIYDSDEDTEQDAGNDEDANFDDDDDGHAHGEEPVAPDNEGDVSASNTRKHLHTRSSSGQAGRRRPFFSRVRSSDSTPRARSRKSSVSSSASSEHSIVRASYPLDLAAINTEELRHAVASAGKSSKAPIKNEGEADISSTKSIKSWRSDPSGSSISGARSDNDVVLSKPLLELEEFELDNFIKNFSRHTKEVRVPFAPTAARRMPQWSDFRVPANEAELAAAEGRKVTVLTHVDRGLQAILQPSDSMAASTAAAAAAVAGEKVGLPPVAGTSVSAGKDKKKKDAGPASSSAGAGPGEQGKKGGKAGLELKGLGAVAGGPPVPDSPHIKWAPDTPNASALKRSTSVSTAGQAAPSSATASASAGPSDKAASGTTAAGAQAPSSALKRHSSLFHDLLHHHHHHHHHPSSSSHHQQGYALSEAGSGTHHGSSSGPTSPMHSGPNSPALGGMAALTPHPDGGVGPGPRSSSGSDDATLLDDGWEVVEGVAVKHEDGKALLDGVLDGSADAGARGATSAKGSDGRAGPEDDEQVDAVAFVIAYILALVERYAPEELDNGPDDRYREGKLRSHLERLYIIAPFWERFLFGVRSLYRWEQPRRTGAAAMIYFVLWYTDLIPTAFMLSLLYYILQFRFFPPSESYLHEQVRKRMARGIEADKFSEQLRRRSRLDLLDLYKRWIERFGIATQIAAGDIADFHEKVKNLILWRNPAATWRTFTLMCIATLFVTFAPAHYVWKTAFFFLGIFFFILLPLQSHYPRYRRPLSPIWWALWGSPTDFVWGSKILRERHARLHGEPWSAHPEVRSKEGKLNLYHGLFHSRKATKNSNDVIGSGSGGALDALALSNAANAVGGREGAGAGNPDDTDEARKEALAEQLKEAQRGKKLASFFCQHHTVPGHLHVTTKMIYFVALHSTRPTNSRKTCKTELGEIAGLVKTNNFRLLGFHGLKVRKRDGKSMHFSNMSHRDDAFNLILSVTGSVWSKV